MKKIFVFLAIALAIAIPVSSSNSVKSMIIMCLSIFVAVLWGIIEMDKK